MEKRIFVFDTTLRDGDQTPGVNINKKEKFEIAKQLEDMGVDVIEAGFPFASIEDFEAVKTIAKNIKNASIAGFARAVKKDIDTAWEALKYSRYPRIHVSIATSDIHMMYKLKMSPDDILQRAYNMVKYAKSLSPSVEFSPEDATRTRPEFLFKVLEKVIEAGADVININDTVGYSIPSEYGQLIKRVRNEVPNIHKSMISTHCHNDLGLALANSIEGIENGARQIECSINGIGERAGMTALEEIVMAIKVRSDKLKYFTNIKTEKISEISKRVCEITGIDVQKNKAVVGENAFVHSSGIHQHGVISNSLTYEIMSAKSIGITKNNIVLGKYSGRHAIKQRLSELGYEDLENEQINEIFEHFKLLAEKKKNISDKDLLSLIKE